ncbi:hypothetical protein AM1_C0258 (plasmid) [Acaryochloris marina MBIC11017]|uniref:Uncharacterized protein n=1 Tax=Acaryochloris marina (strain MBIC 11017) TaxID=329726 RepID=A8ZMY9_ACAM1|nr:hypothetical protein AM1_C0258 [Acaryochloris marina MBIC11017]
MWAINFDSLDNVKYFEPLVIRLIKLSQLSVFSKLLNL